MLSKKHNSTGEIYFIEAVKWESPSSCFYTVSDSLTTEPKAMLIFNLEVPAVGCSDDDWWTREIDDDDEDDIGDDSNDDGTGVHGRTMISGNDSIFRLKRLSTQNMVSLS